MNSREIADYIRDRYSREENLLLTLVSCALIMENEPVEDMSPAVRIVTETLQTLRESLSESELLSVSMLLAEIDRLQDDG